MLAILADRALTELMALGSIYASQADHKVVGREERDPAAVASFGGSSKLWRR
jgi:hypothetical protein